MASRLELQTFLEEILGTRNVYFQPPASVKISYPCVVYSIGSGDAKHADDRIYRFINSYNVTFIYKRPNIEIIEIMLERFQMCKFDRAFCSENLNHYVFTVYY